MTQEKPRAEFLALAQACGVTLTGKPDGSEPVTVVFTIDAWREFDAALREDKPFQLGLSVAASDVLAERQRQMDVEGWTPEHDDAHRPGELSIAGACYASNAATWLHLGASALKENYKSLSPGSRWPWSYKWWKPTDERRDLVKAGALIIAEIERLDRAVLAARSPK